jgi:hypothetical protein
MAGKQKLHIVARHVAPFAPVALALASHIVAPTKPAVTAPPAAAGAPVAVKCEEVSDFHACHSNYPTGCSPSAGYDAYLNFLKNQLIPPPAATASLQSLSQADFRSLDHNTPQQVGGHSNNHAQFKDQLAQLGEGKVFGMVGYLYYAKLSGAESSNCELAADDAEGTNVDYHIYIGFDPALAGKLRSKQALSPEEKKAITQTSIIVEMTPHYRSAYEEGVWTLDALKQVVGSQVRVAGQLMADSEHNVAGQNCALGLTPACWRASVWELHPVTGFQVCKDNSNNCSSGSSSWAELGH